MADRSAQELKELRWRLELLAFEARLSGVSVATLAPLWDTIDLLAGQRETDRHPCA